VEVGLEAKHLGASIQGYASSGLPGPKGNRETFVRLAEGARDGLAEDELEPAARDIEP
jgi:23S rRNA (cytidine1920-2'-O)/16S rRNA (cytidine1409-2'-O)-methyltransferase